MGCTEMPKKELDAAHQIEASRGPGIMQPWKTGTVPSPELLQDPQ